MSRSTASTSISGRACGTSSGFDITIDSGTAACARSSRLSWPRNASIRAWSSGDGPMCLRANGIARSSSSSVWITAFPWCRRAGRTHRPACRLVHRLGPGRNPVLALVGAPGGGPAVGVVAAREVDLVDHRAVRRGLHELRVGVGLGADVLEHVAPLVEVLARPQLA